MCDSPAPLDLFTCPRHTGGLRLTPGACAALWTRGKAAEPFEPAARCRGCQIGAGHAGAASAAPDDAPPPAPCVRCGATDRRMVHVRGLCVSCYNREREVERGRDRRGHVPLARNAPPVLAVRLSVDLHARPAAGLVELALWVLQRPDARQQAISRCGRDASLHVAEAQATGAVGRTVHGGLVQLSLFPGWGGPVAKTLLSGPWRRA